MREQGTEVADGRQCQGPVSPGDKLLIKLFPSPRSALCLFCPCKFYSVPPLHHLISECAWYYTATAKHWLLHCFLDVHLLLPIVGLDLPHLAQGLEQPLCSVQAEKQQTTLI